MRRKSRPHRRVDRNRRMHRGRERRELTGSGRTLIGAWIEFRRFSETRYVGVAPTWERGSKPWLRQADTHSFPRRASSSRGSKPHSELLRSAEEISPI